jgi:asparagine synthase (glutamine-hydrolysing)
MSLPFLLSQLSHGFGQTTARQSFLWMAPFDPDEIRSIWAAGAIPDSVPATAFADVDAAADESGADGLDRLLYQFLITYLPGNILTKMDRASMFNGLEVRAPFLDRAFAEYACALPGRLKLRGKTRKYVLKQVARRYLPDRIVNRRKHGFGLPIDTLLRTAFRERCEDVLLSGRSPVSSWFDAPQIERLVSEHMTGLRDHGKRLWALYVLFTVSSRAAR